jgi:putative ABC transport system permease protein
MLCKDFVRLVIISFFIASPIAWYFMNRWLQNLSYRNEIKAWCSYWLDQGPFSFPR